MKPTAFCVLQSRVILRTPLLAPNLTLSHHRFGSRLHCKDPATEVSILPSLRFLLLQEINDRVKEEIDDDLASSRRVAIITGAASIGIGVNMELNLTKI